jgi:cytosine/uracil/thiamine/allantoin permease
MLYGGIMRMDKRGKLAHLLFIGVMLLPLLGLLIMDYQVRRANDLTGAYVAAGPYTYASENLLAGAIILGVIVFVIVTFTATKLQKAKIVSTMPLAKINQEIKSIDEKLKKG